MRILDRTEAHTTPLCDAGSRTATLAFPLPEPSSFDRHRADLAARVQCLMDRFAPASLVADFFRWACSAGNPQQEIWFDLCGISRNVRLAMDLMESVSAKSQSRQLVSDALPMLAYQVLEALTENLTHPALTAAFDQAMVECLSGDQRPATEILNGLRSLASGASLFAMSRNAAQFRMLVEQYAREASGAGPRSANGSVWQILVVKMEACRAAVHAMRHNRLGPTVSQMLIDQYRAGAAMANNPVPLTRRLTALADANTFQPALAYYFAVLAPVLPFDTVKVLLADSEFQEALSTAAMLVRLLKDAGTHLLTSEWARTQLERLLDQKTASRDGEDLAAILTAQRGEVGCWLERINQDVKHGEKNLCLTGLMNQAPSVSIPRLCDRLDYLAGLFANGRRYLDRTAQDITVQSWNEAPGKLLVKFVECHEQMFAGAFQLRNN